MFQHGLNTGLDIGLDALVLSLEIDEVHRLASVGWAPGHPAGAKKTPEIEIAGVGWRI
jgi:hypothetical protein